MGGRRHVSVIFKWNWGLPYVKRSADEWLWTGHVETVGERSNKKDLSASTVTILSVVNISWAGPWTSQCHQRVNHHDGHHTANRSSWNFAFRDYGLDNKRLIVSWRSRRLQRHLDGLGYLNSSLEIRFHKFAPFSHVSLYPRSSYPWYPSWGARAAPFVACRSILGCCR